MVDPNCGDDGGSGDDGMMSRWSRSKCLSLGPSGRFVHRADRLCTTRPHQRDHDDDHGDGDFVGDVV